MRGVLYILNIIENEMYALIKINIELQQQVNINQKPPAPPKMLEAGTVLITFATAAGDNLLFGVFNAHG